MVEAQLGMKPSQCNVDVESQSHVGCDSAPYMPMEAIVLVIHCFLSFVVCSVDRINLAVAIIPMSQLFHWSDSKQGLIQSIFFLGYMTTAIVGGRWADAKGGRTVLASGVFVWSLCTALIPLTSSNLPLLLLVRVVLGAGEGVAMPAMNAIVAAAVPPQFRARSLAFIYSGMYVGSILGLLATPPILHIWHYQGAFYVFAIVGFVWVALFLLTTSERKASYMGAVAIPSTDGENNTMSQTAGRHVEAAMAHPDPSAYLLPENGGHLRSVGDDGSLEEPTLFELFSHSAVWAIIVAHFCCTWGYFVLLAWLPTYFNARFSLDVQSSAWLASLPWVCMFLAANIGGALADAMLARGVGVTFVRKIMQGVGFVGPAILLLFLMRAEKASTAVAFLGGALATSAFSQSGVYANHQDIGPRIAGTLLGVSNMFASLPGLLGVWLTGVVLQATGRNWDVVFAMAVAFYILGLIVYTALGTSRRIW